MPVCPSPPQTDPGPAAGFVPPSGQSTEPLRATQLGHISTGV